MIAPGGRTNLGFLLLNSHSGTPILLLPIPEIVTNSADQNHLLVIEGHLLSTWPVSGDQAKQENFLTGLPTSLDNTGGPQQKHLTPMHNDNGTAGVLKGMSIHYQLL